MLVVVLNSAKTIIEVGVLPQSLVSGVKGQIFEHPSDSSMLHMSHVILT